MKSGHGCNGCQLSVISYQYVKSEIANPKSEIL
jgi:hypothetical protein